MKRISTWLEARSSVEGTPADRRRRSTVVGATIAAIALAGSLFVAAPASARATTPDAPSVEAALANVGVFADKASGSSLDVQASGSERKAPRTVASVSAKGLTVRGRSEASTVTMMPVHSGKVTRGPLGTPVFGNTSDSAFALSTSQGNNAGYSILFGQDAPKEYSYEITVDGTPARLEATQAGGVEILNHMGDVVNLLAPPWAVDASGADIATEYTVSGNVVTQVVRHGPGNEYPVVADPRLRCDYLWCTIEASRAETAGIAAHSINGGILCSFIPKPGVPVCAAATITAWATASIARSQGKCIGYRVWARNFISWPHLVYIPCYR